MRGDGSCNAGTCETANMSSIQGLPAPGSEASILITRVHIHPLCELVEFWAKFNQESDAEYERLAKSIQSPGNLFKEFDGNPGDQCLVQKEGIWYRACIVSRNGSEYNVFLIDKGISHSTITSMLAWGRGEYFYLLPEVEFCVLANILPVSPLDRWSPLALKFLKSLSGRTVKVFLQDILMQHRLFVLHIPCVEKQMYEMGFARRLSAQMFKDFLLTSLQSKSDPTQMKEPQAVKTWTPVERLKMKESFMFPELQAGTVETVVVTDVTNPQRIFCQLKVFSQELKKMSEQLSQCCDGRTASRIEPEMIGFPCAARGSDGKWYRSVLQQVFPSNKLVEVLNVDYGTKQIVQMDNVRSLAAEFYRMPVVTYNCSLHGIIDKGVGWTTAQIDYLRTLLLHKTTIAKFEYQSITEGVYYVTLYGDENSNINNLFGSKVSCLLQCEKTLGDYAIRASGSGRNKTTALKTGETQASKKQLHSEPVEDLPMKSTHVAFVQFVSNPSDFWIQTQNYAKELEALMEKMAHFYQTVSNDVVKIPSVGLYCAAKAEDGEYYRAIITEVGKSKVKVHFVDYGNSEAVENDSIRTIPEEFKKLPFLGIKCTLANVRPKAGEWSPEACEFFTKTVMDKSLNVHVVTKIDDCHFVELTDPEAQGEKDAAKLMYASGFAEKDEKRRDTKVKTSMHIAPIPMAHCIGNVQPHNTVSVGNERVTFKEQMFSIGSVLDVNVSYIESPNDFWCQLVQSYGHLKLLMYDLQAQYRNSEFQPFAEMACVARHPENGLWYRALIVYKHETPHVDVLFIDYGQTETVNIFDLRKIEKGFLTLPGQAFRCSLFNLVDPTSAINDWTEEAVERFHNFVETAANSFVILKCTVYAVMYSNKIVFNIVNLETPFESICTSLVNLVKNDPPIIHSGTTFRLDTYYYSNHNVKTGTEEHVTITSVKNVRHFYCQLKRNADVLEDMQLKVATLCEQLQRVKIPSVFGTLCFAKYTDGQWYRGLIKATKPTIIVHFVDYGDTIEVDQADLLPIPKEASDIMSVPVQAVLCCLSDIPDDITREANSWFVTSSTECEFRALIVAKEADGKLVVELYQGRIQVNAKIKKLFEIEMHTNDPPVCHERKFIEPTVKPTHKMEGMEESKNGLDHSFDRKPQTKPYADCVGKKERPTTKPRQNTKANQQLYRHPHLKDEAPNCKEPANAKQNGTPTRSDTNHSKSYGAPKYTEHPKQKDKTPLSQTKLNDHETKQRPTCQSSTKESLIDSNILKLETLADLPPKTITSGMVADVYVSHCNSPLSFYVQLIKEEDDIFSIVEKLNDPNKSSNSIAEVHPGDLVQAEFSDDSSWYRAVVKETQAKTVIVEFVDFGNTETVPLSKISRLDKSFLAFPVYSTHCLLQSAAGLEKGNVLSPEFVSTFENAIGNVGEKRFQCKFIKQSENVWEVNLQDNGVEIDCNPTRVNKQTGTEAGHLQFTQQQFKEDQQLDVYITTIADAQTFWCQSVDSEELDQISESVAKVGDAASPSNPDALSVGSACIALFSEDQLWYRAEILNINGDELSVLFVDYGNTSQVKLSQVRQIPAQLIQNQVQAFLCVLEGFDTSKGSWEPSAVDELSELTADQLLQLTVTKVIMEDGKIKCYVRIEREGQVINESMRKFWKNTESEDLKETQTLDEIEPSTEAETVTTEGPMEEASCKLPLIVEDDVSEIVLLTEGPLKSGTPDFKETCEFLADKDDDPILTDDVKNCSASFVMEFEDQMCSTSSGSQILENLEVNISAITTELCDAPSCSLTPDDNDTVFYCTDDESEDLSSSYEARLMDQDLEDQDLSVLDPTGSEDMSSPLDKCFLEAMDELGFTETPSKSPSKGDDPDACKYYDQIQYPETPEELVLEACSPVVRRAARLVLCLSTNLTGKNKEQDTLDDPPPEALQNEDSFLARSSSVLTPDSFDDSEMIVPESPCSAKVTTVQMVPRSPFSLTSNIDIELESSEESQQSQKGIASIVVPSPDSFNQVIETPESSVPEMTVMPDLMEDVCLSLSGVLAEDSFDLGQDVIASEAAFSESHASVTSLESNEDVADVLPPEETSASLTPDQMSEDERFLYLSVALPDDSFDSDMDKWTLDVTLSEMDPHTASESMNQDLLLPKSGSFPQDSTDHMLDLKAEDILSESSKKEEMPNDELVSEQAADSPDLLSDGGTIDSEICTAISMGDAGEEGDCVTEVSLLDLCAEEKGERENVFDESGDHLRSEEETLDKCAPSVEVPCGQLIVLDDVEMEAEPESCSYSPMSHFPDYPDMAVLTEHVSSLVEEATSTDLTPGEASAESESSDFLDECLLTQMEDSSDDTLTEDSYAEDGLESLLSKVTPLSLLEDGCAQEKLDKE